MFAVIHIPNFPVQVVQRHGSSADTPLALVDLAAPKPIISHVNELAARAGVDPGMTATQALARQANLLIRHRSPALEQAAQEALVQCACCFSPAVEATGPGTCTLDLAGLMGLTSSTCQSWAEQVVRSLETIRLQAQVGVAVRPLVAQYAARVSTSALVIKEEASFLSQLPVEIADPAVELLNLLRRWGVHTLGAVTSLGLSSLVERLGAPGLDLFERASGHRPTVLQRVIASPVYAEEADLEHELEMLEPLSVLLRQFLEQICFRQEMACVVTEELDLTLRFAKGAPCRRQFSIPAPTSKVRTLWRVLETHLENLQTEQPICGLRLSARACSPKSEQLTLFEGCLRDPNQFSMTLGRLGALLGPGRVGFPVVENSHRPDAIKVGPVEETRETSSPQVDLRSAARIGLVLRRFRPPIPATITMELRGPVFLHSPVLQGAIKQVQGPWRSSGQWWDQERWQREEWDVESNGTLARVFREAGAWFVEGFYD